MEDFSRRLKCINFDKLVNFLISINIITDEKYYHLQWDKKVYYEKYETLLKFLNQLIGTNREAVNAFLLENEKFDHCALTGGFPASPPNYVCRFDKESIVEEALLNSNPYTPIVVHGMMGEGKSTLVNGVLSKTKIRKRFDYNIFWISLGNIDNSEEINEKLCRLYLNSVAKTTLPRYLHRPADLMEMKLMISSVFTELRNVLLIIDKVSSSEILKLFDDIVCCKIITTRDKSILNPDQDYNLIELSKGFEPEETKEMFRDFSQRGFDNFINRIHDICKGHPQLLSLVLTYIKDNKIEALKNDEIWRDAIKKIQDGRYEDKIYKAVKMCLDKLKENVDYENLLEYLKLLTVFKKDANIRPEVLRLLFNTDNIRDIMNHFVKRSLVLSFYNEEADNFIYMLHDIFWQYLSRTYESEIVNFHKKLIRAYEKITKNDFSKLPDDNYSLLYIGYHLEGAKEYAKFSIFLNWDFLEAKIKAAGPHDTLADLHRYKKYIIPNEEMLPRFESLIKFIECHGANMYQFPQTDIFQFALLDKNKEYNDLALVTAKQNPEKLYLKLNSSNKFHNFRSVNIKDPITAISQIPQSDNFWSIFGTSNGKIILQIMGKNYIASRQDQSIVDLRFIKDYYLSLSSDGQIVIRKLPSNAQLQTPEYKQKYYQQSYKFDNIIWTLPTSYLNGSKIISAIFTNNFPNNNLICTANEKAEITIWNIKTGNQIKSIFERGGSTVRGLCFSMDDIYLIFAHGYQIFLYHNSKELSTFKQFKLDSVCFENFHHPNKYDIISVCESCIYYNMDYTDESEDHKIKYCNTNEEEKNLCAAISEDFKNIIIGTDQNMIYVFNVTEDAYLQLNFKFRNYSSLRYLNLAFDQKKSKNFLLINSNENRVQRCEIDPLQQIPKVINFFVFSSDWKSSEPLTALINPYNNIEIYHSGHIISETGIIPETVTATCITIFCNNLIYGLENGQVWEFNILSRVKSHLFTLNGPINFLKCFDVSDDDFLNTSPNNFTSKGSFSRNDERSIALVATTKNTINKEMNTIGVYKKINNDTNTLRKLFDTTNLHLFYNKNYEFLLIGFNNQIYTWDINQNELNHKFDFAGTSEINACAINKREELLAICTSQKGNKHNLDVIKYNESIVKSKFRVEIGDRATCVQFVTETCLIAVGLENGNIEVWKVGRHEPTILKPHCGRVNILYSSPLSGNYPILISAGDVVAFWDLRSLNDNKNTKASSHFITDSTQSTMDCFVKKKPRKNEFLLSSIKFETEVKYLSASHDFTKFLIVEHSGNINVMDVVH